LFRISDFDIPIFLTLGAFRSLAKIFLSDRQSKAKLTAFADFALHPDSPAVQLDKFLGQG
jgi:hypothetical protein